MCTVILSRSFPENARQTAFEQDLISAMTARHVPVSCVPGLYHLPEQDSLWSHLAKVQGRIIVAGWIHARPMTWLLARHGIAETQVVTIALSVENGVTAAVQGILEAIGGEAVEPLILEHAPMEKPRWYPIMDKSRCTNCGHCLQFCLFGVYSLEEGKVVAKNPDACKSGCPACSRICPSGAIIFPLYQRDEAIAGAPGKFVTVDAAAREMYEKRTGITWQEPQAPKPAFSDLDDLVSDLETFAKGRQ